MAVLMHFATFLKLLTQSTGDKVRDLSKYAQPGGFDFYRTSRDGVTDLCTGSKTLDEVKSSINALAPQNAVDRNIEIVENFLLWREKQAAMGKQPSRSIWTSPNEIFSIYIEPEISLISGNAEKVLAVYPRKDPRINRDQAGAGIILLQKHYKGSGSEKFGVLDAFGQKAFWSPTNASQAILDHDVAMIENELSKVLAF